MTELHGTAALVRLVARRDRVRLAAWAGGVVALVLVTAASTKSIFPTQQSLDEAAALSRDNPAALAFNGPPFALDTLGGQTAFQLGAFGLLVIGLMNLLLVGRLTRAEEDSGRLELVRAMPVGRRAPLAAGLGVVFALDVAVGALVAASLVSQGLALHGSVVLGASYVAFGLVFVGVTAVTAQVSENPRVASGAAGAVLGGAFALRAIGDIGDGTLSWLSPMGWAQRARPYAGERWWPLLLCTALGVALVAIAAVLAERRDFGAGLVAPRPGPPRAAPNLANPASLALRLHRAAAMWWTLSTLALGAVYGSLATDIEEWLADNDALADVLATLEGASVTDSYLSTSVLVVALLAAGPAVQIAARLRAEEQGGRADAMLATPMARSRWLASHTGAALAASALALLAGGVGLGVAYAATGGGVEQVPRLAGAALVYLPAVWLLAALTVALFAAAPGWVVAGWVALAAFFVVATFGPLLDVPSWVLDVSPFQQTPALPAADLRPLPLVVLTGVVVVLGALAVAAFRRRDLTVG